MHFYERNQTSSPELISHAILAMIRKILEKKTASPLKIFEKACKSSQDTWYSISIPASFLPISVTEPKTSMNRRFQIRDRIS